MTEQSKRRRVVAWGVSIAVGAVFLAIASRHFELWPNPLTVVRGPMLIGAVLLHVPYSIVRAMRLKYVLDPLVSAATHEKRRRFDRRVLYGSGFVSFLVLLVLPFKLGEASRPLLLAQGRERGVALTEAVTSVATERIVDGLMICGLLFGGLALSHTSGVASVEAIRSVGQVMSAVFLLGLVFLLISARDPERSVAVAQRAVGWFGPRWAELAGKVVGRFAIAIRAVLDLGQATRFVMTSALYWLITVVQLWMVLKATGLELGLPAAAAIVAVIGLSIQVPGGPAQAGIFQLGAAGALALFVEPATVAGPNGSSFIALMYGLSLAGAAAMAIPGLVLLARVPQDSGPPPSSVGA